MRDGVIFARTDNTYSTLQTAHSAALPALATSQGGCVHGGGREPSREIVPCKNSVLHAHIPMGNFFGARSISPSSTTYVFHTRGSETGPIDSVRQSENVEWPLCFFILLDSSQKQYVSYVSYALIHAATVFAFCNIQSYNIYLLSSSKRRRAHLHSSFAQLSSRCIISLDAYGEKSAQRNENT